MHSGLIHVLTDWLYVISVTLLAPVMTLELAMLGWTLALCGGFVREACERRGVRVGLDAAVDAVRRRGDVPKALERLHSIRHGLPAHFVRVCRGDFETRELCVKTLADVESEVTASLAPLTFITRVGPMLGLMGTLIPLGPALTGLAAGNIEELSSNLVVAFTTTVIGLVISCLGYGMGLARRVWYRRDLNDLEFLIERIPAEELV